MIEKGIPVVRERTKRNNVGSEVVEDVKKLMQQMMKRLDVVELAK